MDITGMFADMSSTIGIHIVRALIADRLRISYINLMPRAHGGRTMRMYNRCGLGICINIEHHKFNRQRQPNKSVKVMDMIGSAGPLPVNVQTNEFYTEFRKQFQAWLKELEGCLGEARWHTEINQRAVKWLATRRDIVQDHRATDIEHPLSMMEVEGLNISPELESFFVRRTPDVGKPLPDTKFFQDILKR
jgi:hypothetical protein